MKNVLIAIEPGKLPNYKDAIENCGGTAVETLALPEDVEKFGGLLLPGGGDIEPWRYGESPEPDHILGASPDLDAHQLALVDLFVKAGKPILGICRGHQLLHVYFGGTLTQHLPQADRHVRLQGADQVHPTRAEPGIWLAKLYGESFAVNSSHHQGTKAAAELKTVQWSGDGVPEGAVHETLPIWSVQWHPERMCFSRRREDTVDGAAVFRFFLEQI